MNKQKPFLNDSEKMLPTENHLLEETDAVESEDVPTSDEKTETVNLKRGFYNYVNSDC